MKNINARIEKLLESYDEFKDQMIRFRREVGTNNIKNVLCSPKLEADIKHTYGVLNKMGLIEYQIPKDLAGFGDDCSPTYAMYLEVKEALRWMSYYKAEAKAAYFLLSQALNISIEEAEDRISTEAIKEEFQAHFIEEDDLAYPSETKLE